MDDPVSERLTKDAENGLAAIWSWMGVATVRDMGSWESTGTLFASWRAWTERHGVFAGSVERFGRLMDKVGMGVTRKRQAGTGARGYLGVRVVRQQFQWGEQMPRTEIYKHGEDISVVTTASDERDFLDSFTEALVPVLSNGATPRDKREAVRAGFDIVAKLRGYKSEVQERRVLSAGRWPHPSEQPVSAAGADGEAAEA